MNSILSNKKYLTYLITAIIVLILLTPFLLYPLFEKTIETIYEKNFDGVDTSFIISSIKSILFIYIWTEQAFELLVRIFLLSAVYLLGIYLLELDGKISYREILIILLFAELSIIIGNYLTILFNYAQMKFNLGDMRIYESPANLIYYFPGIPKKTPIYSTISSINIFTVIYFFLTYRLINKKIKADRFQNLALYMFVFFLFVLLKIIDPIESIFFNNSPGAL